jgi:hypothetical protein
MPENTAAVQRAATVGIDAVTRIDPFVRNFAVAFAGYNNCTIPRETRKRIAEDSHTEIRDA